MIGAMSETYPDSLPTCSCGESAPNIVIVYHGIIEHHTPGPFPCWIEDPINGLDEASLDDQEKTNVN